jgi:sugar phosphate isomerase/epimerase
VRLSLSEISTVGGSFEEDVVAYAAAGFDAIGIWEFKLPPDDEANLALLAEYGLAVSNCVPAIPSFLPILIPGMETPDEPQERLDALCASVRRLAAYEPESVLCLSGVAGAQGEPAARAVVTTGLRQLADVAREADVRLCLEPVHGTQRDVVSFVNSIEDAVGLLQESDCSDVGLMLDLYHVWDDPAVWDTIGRIAYRISGVHVSDWPADPSRTDRELPGYGISSTRELVGALALSGWDGSLDVEIFSEPDRFWGLPVDEAARRAFAAVTALAG